MGMVETLKDTMRTTSSKPLARVANSMATQPYWNDRIRSFTQRASSLKVHSCRYKRVCSSLDCKAVRTQPNEVEDLVLLCKDVALLVQELPSEFAESLPVKLVAKLKDTCDAAFAAMDSPQGCKLAPHMLSNLVMECSIAVPDSAVVESYKQKLAERMEKAAGDQKISKVSTSWGEIVKTLGTEQGDALIDPFATLLHDCQGMTLAGDVDELLKGVEKTIRWMEQALQDMKARAVSRMCVALELLLPMVYDDKAGASVKTVVQRIAACSAIDMGVADFKGAWTSMHDMLVADEKLELLKEIMRLREALVDSGDKELEKKGVYKTIVDESGNVIEQAKSCLVEKHQIIVSEATQRLQDVAAGDGETAGIEWTGGKDLQDEPFESIVALATSSGMMSWDGKECDLAMKALSKAIPTVVERWIDPIEHKLICAFPRLLFEINRLLKEGTVK